MKRLRSIIFPLLLVLITVVIAALNYTPGTWFTGWDTLHPEFNFTLNFERIIWGVWRNDQGLGTVAAHSHMAELPRLIILWLLSFLFHPSALRYLYIFLCFILGPLGVFVFLKRFIFKQETVGAHVGAFLGALFYIFNLGTVQHFYVAFEMFTTQYAALGWLFYSASEYLFSKRKRYLLSFAVISFFAAPMAYAALLWYAYFLGLILYLGTLFIFERRRAFGKSIVTILLTVFATNAFWLLPNWYFLREHAAEVPQAATNILFSEEAFLHNKQYGNIKDAVVFKNFLFNWNEQFGNELIRQHAILEPWKNHFNNQFVSVIGYVAFAFVIGGVVVAIWQRKTTKLAILPVGLVALTMIINMNPPFSFFFDWLRENVTLFKEGLRFPWTKFSLLLMFASSVYFGLFWQWIFKVLNHYARRIVVLIKPAILVLIIAMFFVYGWPMFIGHLIDQQLRVKIPDEYFAIFEWFNAQHEMGRVAPLPMSSPWGWEYNDWGYQGAGFIWFGIKYPVLARDFDRWSPYNEQYYLEMGTALYARDTKRVEALADKYQIRYFILDESRIFPGSKPNSLWFYETKDIFERSSRFTLAKQFSEKLRVYTFDLKDNAYSYVQSPSTYTVVGPSLAGGYQDQAVQDYKHYIGDGIESTVVYPFRGLVRRYGRLDSNSLVLNGAQGYFKLGKIPIGYTLGSNWTSDAIYPEWFIEYNKDLSIEKDSQLLQDGDNLLVGFPVDNQPVYFKDAGQQNKDCGSKEAGISEYKVIDDYVSFSALSGSSCGYIGFPNAKHDFGQLLVVESRNIEGLPIRLCVTNLITQRCDIYTELARSREWTREIFVIPPYPTGGSGFDVNFNTVSIGNVKSHNEVKTVQMIVFPYYRLENLSFVKNEGAYKTNDIWMLSNQDEGSLFYTVKVGSNSIAPNEGLLVLNSAYEDGWQAYVKQDSFPFIKAIGEHIKENNWANAWVLSDVDSQKLPMTICIVFWPQLLEFVGFLLIPLPFIYALIKKKTKHHSVSEASEVLHFPQIV